jgi:hypothetical protein
MSIDRNALAELTEGILSAIGDSVSAIHALRFIHPRDRNK